jgi:hypothetical protein
VHAGSHRVHPERRRPREKFFRESTYIPAANRLEWPPAGCCPKAPGTKSSSVPSIAIGNTCPMNDLLSEDFVECRNKAFGFHS